MVGYGSGDIEKDCSQLVGTVEALISRIKETLMPFLDKEEVKNLISKDKKNLKYELTYLKEDIRTIETIIKRINV